MTGENILHPGGFADDPARLESVRTRLFAARAQRPRPLRDDKVLADWNGLMIAALAAGARALGERAYLDAAGRAAAFIGKEMLRDGDLLLHRYREGEAGIPGNLDDYAFFIWGLVELYEAGLTRHLDLALRLSGVMLKSFSSGGAACGLRRTGASGSSRARWSITTGRIHRATPSPFTRLRGCPGITGDPAWEDAAGVILAGARQGLWSHPHGHGMLLGRPCSRARGIVRDRADRRRGAREGDAGHAAKALSAPLCHTGEGSGDGWGPSLETLAPYTAAMSAPDSGAAAYVCRNRACDRPVRTAGEIIDLLGIKSA